MENAIKTAASASITDVKIRMYCMGTGDCFILKFFNGTDEKFTMMIDCGTCQGTPKEVMPYVKNLAEYVNKKVDLLVITHEHNDHVSGFAKCESIFKDPAFTIKEAWFAWTENPDDPGSKAKELQKKRGEMKQALKNAIDKLTSIPAKRKTRVKGQKDAALTASHTAFMNGLNTLATINLPLPVPVGADHSLPGMAKIKAILKTKKTNIRYLEPGDTVTVTGLPGFNFYVLGPPSDKGYIFKDGKEGTDVFNKRMSLNESSLASNAFINIKNADHEKEMPFDREFVVTDRKISAMTAKKVNGNAGSKQTTDPALDVITAYRLTKKSWRTIEDDWLRGAGALALRLDSHINNTSLVLALEHTDTKKVVFLPGDAEYGSWESWHAIEKWVKKGKDEKHLVEDLLNRTVFYKVGHHLSYNGTAKEKGILMMDSPDLASMATLDLNRIAKNWKSTMPNKFLLEELIKRCQGKLFIMDEFDIDNKPSKKLNPVDLPGKIYEEKKDGGKVIYKQYTVKF